MKITDVKSFPVYAGSRNYTFVKVETDEDIYGVGEFGITWREQAGVGAVEHLKQHLLGQDPLNTEFLWQLMFRGDFFPGGRIGAAAISAIDIALWDIKGKAWNQPVHMLLGGQMRERVVCYKGMGGNTPEDSAATGKALVADGWQYLRMSVNDRDGVLDARVAVRDAVDHVAAVREAVGPNVDICIDVHTRLDPPDAIRLARMLEPYDMFFIEDPLRCENPQSYRLIRQHVATPLAVGEHYATKWEFRQMVEEELLDYARIDLCIVGGLTEARKVANWCETHYIKIVPHNPLGPVSAAACLHLDLATDNFAVQEAGQVGNPFLEDLFPIQVPYENGYMLPPERPGLGVEFDEKAAANYEFRYETGPQLRRSDGAFTNW
ncbi:MAG: galactonate dehydratase [Candidatus Latescibacterota bacterium]|nr:galactonate dehydratase [Candidatus Latescibacterota bacterium]